MYQHQQPIQIFLNVFRIIKLKSIPHLSQFLAYVSGSACPEFSYPLKFSVDSWLFYRRYWDTFQMVYYNDFEGQNLENCAIKCFQRKSVCVGLLYIPSNMTCRLIDFEAFFTHETKTGVSSPLFYAMPLSGELGRGKTKVLYSKFARVK